ncbi:uncharacterized protein LOC136064140 [Quercus suber]|uniref:uncharacterized protein LOC136064140 n=1 Tax=Quercus suber TaxID=58331 RepID=UPI0032DF374F
MVLVVRRLEVIQEVIWRSLFIVLSPSKINNLLIELHEGICGSHVGGQLLVHQPNIQRDAAEYVKRCEQYQKHALVIHQPIFDLAYLQSNGQAEATNKAIVSRLKKRLKGAKGKWTKELPNVLRAYRTMPQRSTGETLYSLTYGVEAVIPMEISLSNMRVSNFSPAVNDELMTKQLDLLEEHREMATIRLANYQQKMVQRYDKWLRLREFCAGDLVLHKGMGGAQDLNVGKLASN